MSMPKYIVNVDELAGLLGDGLTLNANVADSNLEGFLKDYFEKILAALGKMTGGVYMQCSVGLHSYIPALAFDYELIHVFEEDVYITGITYSQTGWKVRDCWSLYIGDTLLFDSIFTKELGEYKHFNIFYCVQAGIDIKIVYHNKSGNSKQIWFDINYLKINPEPYIILEPIPAPEPDPPPVSEPDPPESNSGPIPADQKVKLLFSPLAVCHVTNWYRGCIVDLDTNIVHASIRIDGGFDTDYTPLRPIVITIQCNSTPEGMILTAVDNRLNMEIDISSPYNKRYGFYFWNRYSTWCATHDPYSIEFTIIDIDTQNVVKFNADKYFALSQDEPALGATWTTVSQNVPLITINTAGTNMEEMFIFSNKTYDHVDPIDPKIYS